MRREAGSASYHLMLGTTLAAAGQYGEAIPALTAARSLAPTDARVRYNLGGALVAAGRTDEAITEFAEAVRLAPDVVAYRQALEIARRARSSARGPAPRPSR